MARKKAPTKSPAFQFYPGDFLSDLNVTAMTSEEVGAYWLLICHCWIEGSLPEDEEVLARLARVPLGTFQGTWSRRIARCFVLADGWYRHPRLDVERKKQSAYKKEQSKKGKKSAEVRAESKGNRGSTVVQPWLNSVATGVQPPLVQPEGKSSSSSPSSSSSSPSGISSLPSVEKQAKATDSEFRRFTDAFTALYREASGSAVGPTWDKKHGAMVKTILSRCGGLADEGIQRAENLFRDPPPGLKGLPDLGTLFVFWDRLVVPGSAGRSGSGSAADWAARAEELRKAGK